VLLPLVSSQLYSRVIGQVYGVGLLDHGYCGISKLSNCVTVSGLKPSLFSGDWSSIWRWIVGSCALWNFKVN
jgi:hypothetical protein